MKKIFAVAVPALILAASCQSPTTKQSVEGQQLAQEAIAVHDEIMPQISVFDKTAVRIDSILSELPIVASYNPNIDTAVLRTDLETLKANLEGATDFMMTWMYEYRPDSTDIEYQKAEVEKVKAMKKQFDEVTAESNAKLSSF